MSHPRYDWRGYVKAMIRRYPERRGQALTGTALREYEAVQAAIEQTERMRNGRDRLRVIELVYWKRVCDLKHAGLYVWYSEDTVQNWHADFIKAVAKNFRCDSLLDD